MRLRHFLLTAVAACALLSSGPAAARPDGEGGAAGEKDDLDARVAEVLYQRGMTLFSQSDHKNARKMFIESLEVSPKGPRSKDALRMLRNVNERLGYDDLDAGRPGVSTGGETPLDPYAGGGGGEEGPLDPYADNQEPLDPYAGGSGGGAGAGPKDESPSQSAHRTLMIWGGAYGLVAGLAAGGPESDNGDVRAGAVLLGLLGAGGGVALSHLWWKHKPMTTGQANATASAGFWGAYDFGLIGDLATGINTSDTNDVYKFIAGGGLVGTGLGALYAYKAEPSAGDVAFINSLGLYGTTSALLFGVGLSPVESEGYSLNALLGSAAGLGAGYFLSRSVETSRKRMLFVDLGAATGAIAPWVLIYPLAAKGSTNDDEQAVGYVSALTLAGGAVTAWLLTRDYDDDSEGLDEKAVSERYPAPPALVSRSYAGRWRLGMPLPKPLPLPDGTGGAHAPRLGLDLLSGRF